MTPVSYIQPHEIKTAYAGDVLSDSVDNTSKQFVQARLAGRSLATYPGTVPPDLATAYRIQATSIDAWPDAPCGWKVARIGPQWQAQYPEERLIGPVFARNVHVVGPGEVAVCPIIEGGFAAIEAEIGIYVNSDAPAGRFDWTAEQAASLVGRMCIGVEVASSPLATLNDLGPGAVISDFGNNWGVIAGAEVSDWRTRAQELAVETFIGGTSVGRAHIAIPATPLAALAFALRRAAQQGRALKRGDYISTGMITGVHDIRVGEEARLTFGEYGEILCRMVRAGRYGEGAR
jgi:2-keto-4-pentenoate hydratase